MYIFEVYKLACALYIKICIIKAITTIEDPSRRSKVEGRVVLLCLISS